VAELVDVASNTANVESTDIDPFYPSQGALSHTEFPWSIKVNEIIKFSFFVT